MANRTFRTDVINSLGIEHDEAQAQALNISISNPSAFYKMRSDLLRSVLNANVQNLYNTIFNALNNGTMPDGRTPILPMTSAALVPFQINGRPYFSPKVPEQEINKIALSICASFKRLIESEIVDVVLPKSFFDLSKQKTAQSTRNNISAAMP
jgi:hypothetical protein